MSVETLENGIRSIMGFNLPCRCCGETQYGLHAVEKRYRVGRVTNLGPLNVEWDARP